MSLHIGAEKGQISQRVLLPGDPLRAKWIAETFLKDVRQYNSIRGMLGFTGTGPDGRRVSVQGSGMGMPSLGIYVHELINEFEVQEIIRVGSAGSLAKDLPCQSIVLASGASTDSAMNNRRFDGMHFAPVASYNLLKKADATALELNIPVAVGPIASVDKFYEDVEPHTWKLFADYGALAIEMETAELYTQAAYAKIEALSILTISDHLITGEKLSPELRETSFFEMVAIALAL